MGDTVRFVHAEALLLVLLLPPIWMARRRALRHLRESRRKLEGPAVSASVGSFFRVRLAGALLFAATSLLIVTLARPQVFTVSRQPILRQLDVVFLLDTSPSMGAEDVPPSRLERATQVMRDIVVGEPRIQRVGLVTFTRASLILSYLTSDVHNVLFYLEYLGQQSLPGVGTNIGAAIESGMQVVERSRDDPNAASNQPVLILLSDGEDREEQLEGTLRKAAGARLPVQAIGIGSRAGGFIPLRDDEGEVRFLEDSHGGRLISRLDERTLRRVADVTGGRFYRATEGEELLAALREILSREAQIVGVRDERRWVDLHHSVLAATAALALLGWSAGRD